MYGATLSSIAWFKSYLSEEAVNFVKENYVWAVEGKARCAPAKSILGLVLFFLLVNDTPLHVEKSIMDIYAYESYATLYPCEQR